MLLQNFNIFCGGWLNILTDEQSKGDRTACSTCIARALQKGSSSIFYELQTLLCYFMLVCFANRLSATHFLRGQRGQNHWVALVTGYGAMAGRLWTILPTVQFSHTVISTLVAVKILCKCPAANFPVLRAWPYGPAQQ